MTVYGITFDHTTNYGSCLQAYALQKVIESIQIHKGQINYQLCPIQKMKDWPGNEHRHNIKLSSVLVKGFIYFHRIQFKKFEKKYIKFANILSIVYPLSRTILILQPHNHRVLW